LNIEQSPNNLWNLAQKKLQQNKAENKETNEFTKVFVFVGDKHTGKTNLVLKYLDIQVNSLDSIKETVSLDFKYGTKKREETKVHIHTYELGGGRVLSNMLQSALPPQNLSKIASICILIDLSQPGNVINSLNFWLSAVRENLNSQLQTL